MSAERDTKSMITMRRVLFVAYHFPPLANSGTQRPTKFAKYLPQSGWEPVVIAGLPGQGEPEEPALLSELAPGLAVERVPMLNQLVAAQIAAALVGTKLGTRLGEGISWRARSYARFPDFYRLWRVTATRAGLRLFRRAHFDAIFATGFPWTSLIVGRDIARQTARPLVADFRDLWAGDDLFGTALSERRRKQQRALEASVVQSAAAVITVSHVMTKRMIRDYPDIEPRKFHTISNGYDPEDSENGDEVPAPPVGTFRVVFTGVWKSGYGLDALYETIEGLRRLEPETLSRMEVIAAGFPPGEAARRGIDEHVREIGRVSHRYALGLMKTAGMLFVSIARGAYEKLALPGKLFEYLASGRPVLVMGDPDGEAARLLVRLGGGRVLAYDDREGLKRLLREATQQGVLSVPPIDNTALAEYTRHALTKRLARVLTDVTQGDRPTSLAPVGEDA